MFLKKEVISNFDIIIGAHSIIKGDIQSEGSIRIEGKVYGDITALGNVIISEKAYISGSIISQNADIYGQCEGDVKVRGKINLHHNSSLIGDIIAKSFNTQEGSTFKGNCIVDPEEELIICIDPLLKTSEDSNLINFSAFGEIERDA